MAKSWKVRLEQAIKRGYTLEQDIKDAGDWKSCKIGEVVNKSKLIKNNILYWTNIHDEAGTEGLSKQINNYYDKLETLGYEFSNLVDSASKSGCDQLNCTDCTPKSESERIKSLKKALKISNQIDKIWAKFVPLRKKAIKEGILVI